jgi:excinuclease UvrABC nuclease subunit
MLAHAIPFDPANPAPALAQLPQKPGVFALFGSDPAAEPYLSRTPNLQRRLKRFLDARPSQGRRLRLTERVARIEYSPVGSDFESWVVLYQASLDAFGERARKRMHLTAPPLIRFAAQNPYPRTYVTTRITKSALDSLYGPFPSRVAAERFLDEALNLFLLRRCVEDLNPDPAFPGCVYSEMKMCLAPCFKGCSDERYAEEAAAVRAFLDTRGQSLLDRLAAERDQASAELEFEQAAALHQRIQKVQAIAALAPESLRPLSQLRAIILQPAAEANHVALFLLSAGRLTGPALYSVAGMRHPNEQSGSSSLYAHPVALEPVPLNEETGAAKPAAAVRGMLESRLEEAHAALEEAPQRGDNQTIADHLCLFKRWYFRPAARRSGEVLFWDPNGAFPAKAVLRAVSRVFRGATAPETAVVSTPVG